jgi:hypothetical protein
MILTEKQIMFTMRKICENQWSYELDHPVDTWNVSTTHKVSILKICGDDIHTNKWYVSSGVNDSDLVTVSTRKDAIKNAQLMINHQINN